ncbi:MAG: hypothetical protein ACE5GU_14080 [Candidatus Scalinduaceae bacterium]
MKKVMEKKLISSKVKSRKGIKASKYKANLARPKDALVLSGDTFRLGNLLLDGRFIDVNQRDESLEMHRKKHLLLGECLTRNGAINGETLDTVLTFQGKIRELIHKARTKTRLKLGQLLVATRMLSVENLKKAIRIQRRSKKLLGEILVENGVISRNILALALSVQKKILVLTAFALLSGSLIGCTTLSPGHYDQIGVSTKKTPYDDRYKRVKKYLKTASKFKYKADGIGADYWQLPFETERLGRGDCDDKAIWLYSKLLKEGFDDVRLVLGNYKRGKLSVHMWVNWYHNGQVYILDPTINNGIWKAEDYSRDYYKPYYSFYRDKKWKHSS